MVFFFINYAYTTTTGRSDGYNPGQYEMSTVSLLCKTSTSPTSIDIADTGDGHRCRDGVQRFYRVIHGVMERMGLGRRPRRARVDLGLYRTFAAFNALAIAQRSELRFASSQAIYSIIPPETFAT